MPLHDNLARESIHDSSTEQHSLSTGLNAKKFYGSSPGTVSTDLMVRRSIGPAMLRPNGKVVSKMTGHLRQKTTTASELNDPSMSFFKKKKKIKAR